MYEDQWLFEDDGDALEAPPPPLWNDESLDRPKSDKWGLKTVSAEMDAMKPGILLEQGSNRMQPLQLDTDYLQAALEGALAARAHSRPAPVDGSARTLSPALGPATGSAGAATYTATPTHGPTLTAYSLSDGEESEDADGKKKSKRKKRIKRTRFDDDKRSERAERSERSEAGGGSGGEVDWVDGGVYWCADCHAFPNSALEYLAHLHTPHHMQTCKARPWHGRPSAPRSPSPDTAPAPASGAPRTSHTIQGAQLMYGVRAWYCALCDQFAGDLHCALLHLRTPLHNNQYKRLQLCAPAWEGQWRVERMRALHGGAGVRSAPPPPRLPSPPRPVPLARYSPAAAAAATSSSSSSSSSSSTSRSPSTSPSRRSHRSERSHRSQRSHHSERSYRSHRSNRSTEAETEARDGASRRLRQLERDIEQRQEKVHRLESRLKDRRRFHKGHVPARPQGPALVSTLAHPIRPPPLSQLQSGGHAQAQKMRRGDTRRPVTVTVTNSDHKPGDKEGAPASTDTNNTVTHDPVDAQKQKDKTADAASGPAYGNLKKMPFIGKRPGLNKMARSSTPAAGAASAASEGTASAGTAAAGTATAMDGVTAAQLAALARAHANIEAQLRLQGQTLAPTAAAPAVAAPTAATPAVVTPAAGATAAAAATAATPKLGPGARLGAVTGPTTKAKKRTRNRKRRAAQAAVAVPLVQAPAPAAVKPPPRLVPAAVKPPPRLVPAAVKPPPRLAPGILGRPPQMAPQVVARMLCPTMPMQPMHPMRPPMIVPSHMRLMDPMRPPMGLMRPMGNMRPPNPVRPAPPPCPPVTALSSLPDNSDELRLLGIELSDVGV